MIKLSKTSALALAIVTSIGTLIAVPAFADNSFRGGASAFEDAARDYGRQVAQGARNYGSRAAQGVRNYAVPIGRGISAINQSRTLLRYGAPLPLIIMPKDYNSPSLYLRD